MRCAVRRPVSAYLASACLAAGCVTSHPAAPSEACVPTARTTRIQLNGIDRIDLLFVIDDSASMAEEQAALASALPEMIAMLTSGDLDRDGDSFDRGDFPGLRELNVGVITTNMGSGGHAVPTCAEPELGDDGLMRTEGAPGCAASYARFYRFGDDAGALARGAACVVAPGTRGCGIEQPLEAVLKALSPSSAQPWTSDRFVPVGDPSAPGALREPFFGGTPPHGDREHAGFVGEDGLLVVVAITDEDDCSIRDPELFDPESRRYTAPLALRCSASPDALHPIERYVEGLLQLRPRPSQLVFAPIVGAAGSRAHARRRSRLDGARVARLRHPAARSAPLRAPARGSAGALVLHGDRRCGAAAPHPRARARARRARRARGAAVDLSGELRGRARRHRARYLPLAAFGRLRTVRGAARAGRLGLVRPSLRAAARRRVRRGGVAAGARRPRGAGAGGRARGLRRAAARPREPPRGRAAPERLGVVLRQLHHGERAPVRSQGGRPGHRDRRGRRRRRARSPSWPARSPASSRRARPAGRIPAPGSRGRARSPAIRSREAAG